MDNQEQPLAERHQSTQGLGLDDQLVGGQGLGRVFEGEGAGESGGILRPRGHGERERRQQRCSMAPRIHSVLMPSNLMSWVDSIPSTGAPISAVAGGTSASLSRTR